MYPFPINVIGKFIESWYFRLYQNYQFWTVSPSTVEELVARGIPREQCTAILNPIIHDETWDNEPFDRLRTGQKTENKKEKSSTYIFVSRVVKMKGIEEVIKAFSFIVRVQNNAQLWIVGGGEASYIEELKNMINEYGVGKNVVFFGKVSEQKKFELMARSHILLHASVKEGWGLVVPEAASVGTPSVVYDVPGLRDVVKNGKTGIVLAKNSPQEMAKEVVILMKDKHLYHTFQQSGLQWVRSLDWEKVTKESAELLKKAIILQ
jgi:glycosyltransferase involved in cell wall biosynthesis